jgi:hypothetical protein
MAHKINLVMENLFIMIVISKLEDLLQSLYEYFLAPIVLIHQVC